MFRKTIVFLAILCSIKGNGVEMLSLDVISYESFIKEEVSARFLISVMRFTILVKAQRDNRMTKSSLAAREDVIGM